jgi:hypothetical protein
MVYAAANNPWEFLQPWSLIGPENRPLVEVSDFLGLGLNVLLGTTLAVSMISLILSGIKFVTAKGDPKAKAAAQQSLTYAVVAFILGIGAFTLKTIIFNVVGGDYGSLRNATPNF